jgi:hypothetical protein
MWCVGQATDFLLAFLSVCSTNASSRRLARSCETLSGRNDDYVKLNIEFTMDVAIGRKVLNLFPDILKPYAILPSSVISTAFYT